MADEYSRPPNNREMPIPAKYNRLTLTNKNSDELEVYYNNLLTSWPIRPSAKKVA
jgi:type I restriction enzyme M protein